MKKISAVVGYLNEDYKYVIFATKKGYTKKSLLKEYLGKRKAGLQGIKLKTDARLLVLVLSQMIRIIILTTGRVLFLLNKQMCL